jgi:hypothetical protein
MLKTTNKTYLLDYYTRSSIVRQMKSVIAQLHYININF